ncbi:ABC transporter ATP-binding protein [Candidatus Sumerlaeota bacterium]|nr:ABC transporter ATP-binding protein [Candidatus Sumerlaeota bacterium]
MIRVQDLRKHYGPIRAVDGISFEIERGETFGLLGPNGAGKTTTIHMIAGILPPDAGSVEINGSSDPTRASVRSQLGVAPQALALYEELTGEENLAFFGRLHGLRGATLRGRVQWALEFAELTERRRSLVKTYSGGMKRRLNLAIALIHEPPALLLDEPTVGVDPQSRNHIFGRIEDLRRRGLTVLYTTHYMEEAQRLCDRVAIMDHGKMLDVGTVDELISRHGGVSVIEAELERPPESTVSLPGTLEGTSLRIETTKPLEEVARLAELGVRITALKVHRPDLETVFLALTGRRLRD